MDRYLGQLWSAPSMVKPEGKKLKRKLQKLGSSQQQRPQSVSFSSDVEMSPAPKPHKSSLPFHLFSSSTKPSAPQHQHRPSLPPPTNSDDGKWLQDFRKSGYLYRDSRRSSSRPYSSETAEQKKKNSPERRPVSMVPEFAYLAASAAPAAAAQDTTTTTISAPPVKTAPSHMTRRYAKTPVSHIGQLETHHLLRTQGTASQDVPTIESIAESYRALLESRTSFMTEGSVGVGVGVDRLVEKHDDCFVPQDPTLMPPPLEPVAELPEPLLARRSPRSDDGTLVEEESIDLKHSSNVSSRLPSALNSPSRTSYVTASPGLERRVTAPPRNPDLQTCLDLLTRELSSAVNRSSSARAGRHDGGDGADTDTAALQVLVMIEAYEKLRDQILDAREGDAASLKAMLDTWLDALHSVHDGMVGGDGEQSESDYGD